MKLFALLALSAWALSVQAASPNDTVIIAPSISVITDAAGNTWGISNAQVTKNGAVDKTTAAVIELAYVNNVLWQENTGKLWYSWTGTGWSGATGTSPVTALPSQAYLTWTAPTTDTNGQTITVPLTYNVYRGSSATSLSKLTNVTGTTYTDPAGSTTPTTYFYGVTVVQSGQESAISNIVSGTIAAPTLIPAPAVLTIAVK